MKNILEVFKILMNKESDGNTELAKAEKACREQIDLLRNAGEYTVQTSFDAGKDNDNIIDFGKFQTDPPTIFRAELITKENKEPQYSWFALTKVADKLAIFVAWMETESGGCDLSDEDYLFRGKYYKLFESVEDLENNSEVVIAELFRKQQSDGSEMATTTCNKIDVIFGGLANKDPKTSIKSVRSPISDSLTGKIPQPS